MLSSIIRLSIRNKLIVWLFTFALIATGLYSLTQLSVGAVPDITNNQVQVITTSRNLGTLDVEQFITHPIELEMANLPGVTEIRSVSKFGLSVVTVVFEDRLGTFLPRQLIAEKLKTASEHIPEGFGTPEMGPISTGLGEIYQYTLETKPGFEPLYPPMRLREIQDWVVKRQLAGIPGVVEVNTWGGFLKQYEVAVSPEKLRAMHVSLGELFTALQNNNQIAGGGYIEKGGQSYFIRGEGLIDSLSDLRQVVVKAVNGVPILVQDVAEVRYGHAVRFGAITGNGEGEKVLGQIMMLKGANASQVIEAVKIRVAEIQQTLPEGVYINGFLERSELIGKTTQTVAENLLLGCLIVVFVLVLLLGNWRSGLVVASIIPLSLFFAVSMMTLFGVDANLMSLGAVDFGIIIDGAVIIVEFIAFKITGQQAELSALQGKARRQALDSLSEQGATRMMNSAVFGQLIVLLVFIPIFTLSGVEGKMFRPMALTFGFALVGAIILCFTYVPVAAATFLRPESKNNAWAESLMNFLKRAYLPVVEWALKFPKMVLSAGLALFLATLFIFSRMGGEFVPTLDEGDFVIQPVLQTGTSLGRTIEICTQIEEILLTDFPEVAQVVSRIGAAEIPTDPMSLEESDIIIRLKPRKEWVSARTKDALADRFKERLSVLPGIEFEFTQPIEMRFNELITGVRADVAIKVFGDDLEILAQKADEIALLIADVEGAADIVVEKIEGLPQLSVRYHRDRLAKYGLNLAELNRWVAMAFAGETAGSIYEQERRFDLVMRFQSDFRQSPDNLRKMFVDLPNGSQIPLDELAEVVYTQGPAQISRDNTRRRIVVGVNVRNRDMESVVKEIQQRISESIKLPIGYAINYGGQFENLRAARQRLLVAAPIALFLIFLMLYFALKSLRDALLVFAAIPLAAIGGVLLLWLRGMPFSISAGVGFIALFGLAVLNGIMLIEHFNELREQGMHDLKERIIKGTQQRLRPVLLTATTTAFGFMPMVVSTSVGAEVQRPLSTVVVGGLLTATFLTLVILPVLYYLAEKRKQSQQKASKSQTVRAFSLGLLLGIYFLLPQAQSQAQELSITDAQRIALENNLRIKAAELQIDQTAALRPAALDFEKTTVYHSFDENNIAPNDLPIRVFGLSQTFRMPAYYKSLQKINAEETLANKATLGIQALNLQREVSQAYYHLVFLQQKEAHYRFLDSLFQEFSAAAQRRFELGESNYLEALTARTKKRQVETLLLQTYQEQAASKEQLRLLLQTDSLPRVAAQMLPKLRVAYGEPEGHPGALLQQQRYRLAEAQLHLQKQELLPDLQLGYFQGTNRGENAAVFHGYEIGLRLPLLFGAQQARIRSARIGVEMADQLARDFLLRLNARIGQLKAQLQQYAEALNYYETDGKELSDQLVRVAKRSYFSGEIDFFQYIQSLETAREIELTYLENLNQYNQTVLAINYLTL